MHQLIYCKFINNKYLQSITNKVKINKKVLLKIKSPQKYIKAKKQIYIIKIKG